VLSRKKGEGVYKGGGGVEPWRKTSKKKKGGSLMMIEYENRQIGGASWSLREKDPS